MCVVCCTLAGWQVGNADVTIAAFRAPKMAPHIDIHARRIAEDLQVSLIRSTSRPLPRTGFTGREEGIAVHAVALLGR
jgi:2-C-methyl-D-erythritol 2,4-cyclodiphosphate synthase